MFGGKHSYTLQEFTDITPVCFHCQFIAEFQSHNVELHNIALKMDDTKDVKLLSKRNSNDETKVRRFLSELK